MDAWRVFLVLGLLLVADRVLEAVVGLHRAGGSISGRALSELLTRAANIEDLPPLSAVADAFGSAVL
jgi:hypothetical protein